MIFTDKTACTTTLREASPTPRITRQARTSNAGLPIVAFTLSDDFKKDFPHVKQVAVSNLMRAKQYIIPNYPLPPNEEQTEISRVVVRESMSLDLLDRLVSDRVGND